MKRLFLFNPENDIALGAGLPRITPPRQAALLHRAGGMIPFWLGEDGDMVLVDTCDIDDARRWAESIRENMGVEGPRPVSVVTGENLLDLHPWGWSLDTVAQFEKAGVMPVMMDGIRGEMERRRELSHRRSSLKFLSQWVEAGLTLPYPLPVEVRSAESVEQYIAENGDVVLKSPWSSSGRGVFPVTTSTFSASLPRIEGIIRHQGSIIVESMLPKLQDFAMLFYYRDGVAEFAGYSLFFNSTNTNYGGNLVASDDAIVKTLGRWIARHKIEAVRNQVAEILPGIIGRDYQGPLGVDMMVCSDVDDPWIAPCVEINLRYTMGFVARGVWRKLGREGVMSVAPKNCREMVESKNGEKPLRLVPENQWFDFTFYPKS